MYKDVFRRQLDSRRFRKFAKRFAIGCREGFVYCFMYACWISDDYKVNPFLSDPSSWVYIRFETAGACWARVFPYELVTATLTRQLAVMYPKHIVASQKKLPGSRSTKSIALMILDICMGKKFVWNGRRFQRSSLRLGKKKKCRKAIGCDALRHDIN